MTESTTANTSGDAEAITPYTMHVSQRYLELTKKKLELTRLPRELELPDTRLWEHGTPKSVLEPLLDFWLDGYNWRHAESALNTTLPQFRTTISIPSSPSQNLRIHFVHKRSPHPSAIPLLMIHSWPSSFIEVQRVIDALVDPQRLPSFGMGAQQAFHVVAPSIPGFGFSDEGGEEGFGLKETAEVFDGVMRRLGYGYGYVVHGVGWGFSICRALAMNFPERCLAVHTANPSFAEPTAKHNMKAWMKYKIAKMTKGKLPGLGFGYLPDDFQTRKKEKVESRERNSLYSDRPLGPTLHQLYSLRPQTLSYSLCDSPVGLLAALLDVIHTRVPSGSPLTSRSRSPFLSPVELEMQESNHVQSDEHNSPGYTDRPHTASLRQNELEARNYTWTPTEILNWTMMQWLPGPESSLRWLRQAHIDTTTPHWDDYCSIPLGISSFRGRNSETTPLMWGSTSWNIGWIKRHQRPATLPAWEAPDLLVLDLRECLGTFLAQGKLANLPIQESAA